MHPQGKWAGEGELKQNKQQEQQQQCKGIVNNDPIQQERRGQLHSCLAQGIIRCRPGICHWTRVQGT